MYYSIPRDGLVFESILDGVYLDTNDGNKSTVTNAGTTFANTQVGYAKQHAVFDGSSSYISVTDRAELHLTTLTLHARVFIEPYQQQYTNVLCKRNSWSDIEWQLFLWTGSALMFMIQYHDWSGVQQAVSDKNYTEFENQWLDIVVTITWGVIRWYFNGKLDISTYSWPSLVTSNAPVLIWVETGGYSATYFKGKIQCVRIYNRVITETEIQQLWHEFNRKLGGGSDFGAYVGSPVIDTVFPAWISYDASQQAAITTTGSPSAATDKFGISNGITLSGTGQYLSLPSTSVSNVIGASARTFFFHIKPSTASGYRYLFAYGNNTTEEVCVAILNVLNSGDIYWWFNNNDYYTAGNVIQANTEYTVILTYDGGTLSTSTVRCYVNGANVGLTKTGSGSGAANTQSTTLYIGCDSSNANLYAGDIYRGMVFPFSVDGDNAKFIHDCFSRNYPYSFRRSIPYTLTKLSNDELWLNDASAYNVVSNGTSTYVGSPSSVRVGMLPGKHFNNTEWVGTSPSQYIPTSIQNPTWDFTIAFSYKPMVTSNSSYAAQAISWDNNSWVVQGYNPISFSHSHSASWFQGAFSIQDPSWTYYLISSPFTLTQGNFYRIAMRRSGTTMDLFINGSLASTWIWPSGSLNSVNNVYIGCWFFSGAATNVLNCIMYWNIRIISSALTNDQVFSDYISVYAQ